MNSTNFWTKSLKKNSRMKNKVFCHKCQHKNDKEESFKILQACLKKDDKGDYKYPSVTMMNRDGACPDFCKKDNAVMRFFKKILTKIF